MRRRPASDGPHQGAQTVPFGAVLRQYRRAAGLTQEELAERSGLSREAISLLERGGRRRPYPYTVQVLATALHLAPAEQARLMTSARRSGASTVAAPPEAAALPPLMGREQELALLEQHLRGQGPPVVLLAGEPGIGKSRILAEVGGRGPALGWTVLRGGCRRGGQEPYAPLAPALERYLRHQEPVQRSAVLAGCAWLVRLLPDVADLIAEPVPPWSLTAEHERQLMVAAVRRVLGRVAGPAGTLVVLDDLQWAGADALDLLAALLGTVETPLRVVAAYRDTEAPPQSALATWLADLAHAGPITHHVLHPLGQADAAQLLGRVLEGSALDEAVRQQVVQRTGGVPFFLLSCALAVRPDNRPARGQVVVPWDVAHSVRHRVAALPAEVQEVLATAAVIGGEVPTALLMGVCAQATEAVLVALEAAGRARLLEEVSADAYRFVHDVIRDVVEADVGAARRRHLHGRIGQVLERAGPGAALVEALAYHYSRSGDEEKAVRYLEQAGDRSRERYAHAAALGYYDAAVERLDRQGDALAAASVRQKLGEELVLLGQYDRALTVLDAAAEAYRVAGDPVRHGQVLLAIALAHTARGTPQEPLERVRQALAVLEDRGAWPGVAALCLALSNLYFYLPGQVAEGLSLTGRALQLAPRLGDDRLLAVAQQDHACNLFKAGRWDEALPGLEEAARRLDAIGDLAGVCWCLQTAAGILGPNGQVTQQRAYSDRAVALAERLGDPLVLAMMLAVRGVQAFWSGDWMQTRGDCARALEVSRTIGAGTDLVGTTVQHLYAAGTTRTELAPQVGPPRHFVACVPLLYLGQLCLAEGDLPAATGYLEEAATVAVHHHDIMAIMSLQARLDLLDGRPAQALARLVALSTDPEPWEWWEWPVTPLRVLLAWAHLDVDQVAQAAALAEQAAARARAVPSQRALVEALWMQARIASRQQHWEQARRALDEGLALAQRIEAPYAVGRLLRIEGHWHAAQEHRDLALQRCEEALAIFQELGARGDAQQMERAITRLQETAGMSA